MNFKDVLNKYLEELNCSQKRLSKESNLSETVISRYRSGERTPKRDSEQLKKISTAIFNISQEKNRNNYTLDKIIKDFDSTLSIDNFDYKSLSNNLNTLINELNINTNEMAKYIIFDASHISRIRYGKLNLQTPLNFLAKYVLMF